MVDTLLEFAFQRDRPHEILVSQWHRNSGMGLFRFWCLANQPHSGGLLPRPLRPLGLNAARSSAGSAARLLVGDIPAGLVLADCNGIACNDSAVGLDPPWSVIVRPRGVDLPTGPGVVSACLAGTSPVSLAKLDVHAVHIRGFAVARFVAFCVLMPTRRPLAEKCETQPVADFSSNRLRRGKGGDPTNHSRRFGCQPINVTLTAYLIHPNTNARSVTERPACLVDLAPVDMPQGSNSRWAKSGNSREFGNTSRSNKVGSSRASKRSWTVHSSNRRSSNTPRR